MEEDWMDEAIEYKPTLKFGTYKTNKYDNAFFTMWIKEKGFIDLTVGAMPEHRVASTFNKESLQEMINDLQVICNAMESFE